MMFQHLKEVKQNYIEHFFNAMLYSFLSLKASFYFFIHAIWPDIFQIDGSRQILYLYNKLYGTNKIKNL